VKGAAGGDVWMVAGTYFFGLTHTTAGWRISAMTLTVAYQEGNLQLPALASQRAGKAPRRAR
jgi:hypothetical protein